MSVEDDKRIFEQLDKDEADVSKRRWQFAKCAFGRWIGATMACWMFGLIVGLILIAILDATGTIKESQSSPLFIPIYIPIVLVLGVLIGGISAVRWSNRAANALMARDAEKAELASASRIKVRMPDGRIGTVTETDFNADIMERL